MLSPLPITDSLLEDLAALSSDPYKFVLWAFPWGEEETELAKFKGPEPWQAALLQRVRDKLIAGMAFGQALNEAIQEATASGHGVGKSALVAWLILWAMSTFVDTRGVVTANTETQLKTKTWVELNKWHRLFIAKDLFEVTATKICSRDPAHADTWRVDIVPWSERNTEAFAGLHNKGRRIIVIFDEASAIPDVIWETTEGALTDSDTQILWFVFGNPTRNSGRFRECFAKYSARWGQTRVDSREVSITNKTQIAKWIEDYGEDSDFVRVRVRGIFPRAGSLEFISLDLATQASKRDVSVHLHDPLIFGVDVARFGDDETVIYIRKGRDGRTHAPIRLRGADTMMTASRVAELAIHFQPDAIFVDEGGVGGGVVDRLRQLRVACIGIQFGSESDRNHPDEPNTKYANKRAEMWGYLRKWLKEGAIITDEDLISQLVGPQYGFNNKDAIQLEKKSDMKKRGVPSPDIADALALTFAYPVMPNSMAGRDGAEVRLGSSVKTDYDPFSEKSLAA